jgi:hypothetical protein
MLSLQGMERRRVGGILELDERSEEGAIGLRGECDLFPAIGVFGSVDFEVFFSPEDWMFNPY